MQQLSLFESPTRARPTLNPDGFSVKGCSIIYAPKGQAGEYAKLSSNPFRGCGHRCVYCYVPQVLRMSRQDFDAGASPRPGYLDKLKKDAAKYQAAGIREQVMLSFTTDPYNPGDAARGLTRQALEVLTNQGLAFCTLTKGGMRALRDLDLFRPDRDAFATTLTSLDPEVSRKWESGAALPDDRVKTLRLFYEAGIYTWVSLEPVYDTEATLQIISETNGFVNLYKIGRINYHRLTKNIDWSDFTIRAIELFKEIGCDHYVKRDLQPFLPTGYKNEKYRIQHN
jgi:DNA repair photolyase